MLHVGGMILLQCHLSLFVSFPESRSSNRKTRSEFDQSVLMALYSAPTLESSSTDLPLPTHSAAFPKHQCDICQKPFSSAFALNMHVRVHTGEKPFECAVCGAKFSVKGNMKRHQISHFNLKAD